MIGREGMWNGRPYHQEEGKKKCGSRFFPTCCLFDTLVSFLMGLTWSSVIIKTLIILLIVSLTWYRSSSCLFLFSFPVQSQFRSLRSDQKHIPLHSTPNACERERNDMKEEQGGIELHFSLPWQFASQDWNKHQKFFLAGLSIQKKSFKFSSLKREERMKWFDPQYSDQEYNMCRFMAQRWKPCNLTKSSSPFSHRFWRLMSLRLS